jgi:hypothetical protein
MIAAMMNIAAKATRNTQIAITFVRLLAIPFVFDILLSPLLFLISLVIGLIQSDEVMTFRRDAR